MGLKEAAAKQSENVSAGGGDSAQTIATLQQKVRELQVNQVEAQQGTIHTAADYLKGQVERSTALIQTVQAIKKDLPKQANRCRGACNKLLDTLHTQQDGSTKELDAKQVELGAVLKKLTEVRGEVGSPVTNPSPSKAPVEF